MPDTERGSERDPFQHAAAPAFQRIDRDLRTATGVVRAMLRVIRAELFEPGFDVNRIRSALDLRSTKDMAKFRRAEAGPAARVFEELGPLCHLCALEHAPRELADFLFVNSPHCRRQPRQRLDRITEPEKILAGFRRQLSRRDADLLIWALLCRYPASAGVVGEIFGLREQERERLLNR